MIWLVIIQWLSAGVGGFIAGRLRTLWTDIREHEVFFRDSAHGFLVWCTASIAGTLLVMLVSLSGAGAVIKGSAAMAQGSLPTERLGNLNYFTDSLFRPVNPIDTAGNSPQTEAIRILTKSMNDGQVTLSPEDRTYLAQIVSARSGLSQADAGRRVDGVVQQIDDAEQKTRAAADQVRKRTAQLSLMAALAMLIGAFIASAAAVLGGRSRYEI